MPVVINDFEIISDQTPPSQPASAAQEPAQQTNRGTTPYEVESILRREKERLSRVQAH
jgi:hypothetical protein